MTNNMRYLCFNLGTEEFAIPLLTVREVMGLPETTSIPQTPPHFLGIMNLRGQVISLMDLRVKLGIKPTVSEETVAIILDFGEYCLGVVVDQVNSVQELSAEEVADKPTLDTSKASDFITGVFKKQDHLILILNISKALSIEDKTMAKRSAGHAA